MQAIPIKKMVKNALKQKKETAKQSLLLKTVPNGHAIYLLIAPLGHTSAQVPHSVQTSGSIE